MNTGWKAILCHLVLGIVTLVSIVPEKADGGIGRIPRAIYLRARSHIGWQLRDREPKADFDFTIIDRGFATQGLQAEVALVQSDKDQSLWVWKRITSGAANAYYHLAKEIPRSKVWREAGLSEVQVLWARDGVSLLKSYVAGKTAEEIVKNDPRFWAYPSKELDALMDFGVRAMSSGYFILDLRLANLVYDGERFQIVDSLGYRKVESPEELRKLYVKELGEQWGRVQIGRGVVTAPWATGAMNTVMSLRPNCERQLKAAVSPAPKT